MASAPDADAAPAMPESPLASLFPPGGPPPFKLTGQERTRLLVLHLTNWTWEERLSALQSREVLCKRELTEREGRIARREVAHWLADAVAHFNPMITDGTFARRQEDYRQRRVNMAPIDVLIDHAHHAHLYDNRGNTAPLTFPELFRTKKPWGYCVSFEELAPRAWEGVFP